MRLTVQLGSCGWYPDWEGSKALLPWAVELAIMPVDTTHAYGAAQTS